MKTLKDRLQNNYNFRVIPIREFKRDEQGRKSFKFDFDWSKYRDKECEDPLFENAQGLAILTGKVSNLTIVDLDSVGVINSLEKHCGESIETLCNFRVKTAKGVQLFYSYTDVRKKGNIQKLDLLNDGRLTFATAKTPGYEVVSEGPLMPMPPCVKEFLSKNENSTLFVETEIKDFYISPLIMLLQRWQDSKKKVSLPLAKEISTRLLDKIPFYEASQEGGRHNLATHVCGICAADPTISERNYFSLVADFISEVIKPDEDLDPILDYAYKKSFTYDSFWEQKHAEKSDFVSKLKAMGWDTWYNVTNDKYILLNPQLNTYWELSGPAYKLMIRRMIDKGLKADLADVPFFHQLTFQVDQPAGYMRLADGSDAYNTFVPTKYMQMYDDLRGDIENQLRAKEYNLPPFIGAVVNNVMPNKEHRDLFLHNLAYFLKYKRVCQTAIISLGETQGTGKGVLYDKILYSLFEFDHSGVSAEGILNREYAIKVTPQVLNSQFNGSMKNKLYMHCNEVVENHSQFNSQTLVNKLKNIVAEERIVIISKGRDEIVLKNHMFVVMSSNEKIPFKIDSGDNRRFNFFPTSDKKLKDVYPRILDADFNMDKVIEEEMPQFLTYLASLPLSRTEYSRVIETELYNQIKEISTPTSERLAEAIIAKDEEVLEEDMNPELLQKYKTMVLENNLAYIKVSDLKQLAGTYYNSLKKALMSKGIAFELRYVPAEKKALRVCMWNPSGNMKLELNLGGEPPG